MVYTHLFIIFFSGIFQRGSDELLSQVAIMAPASDNNNQDLATKKAKLESGTVLGGVGKFNKSSVHTTFLITAQRNNNNINHHARINFPRLCRGKKSN